MTLGASEVRRLLDQHGISPSRALGQNFVVDPNTITRMVDRAGIGPGDQVIEVGPGVGSLTRGLLDAGAHVTAVEFDQHLLPALREVTDGDDVRIVHGDAMDVDWPELLSTAPSWKVVANLPYNISAPLILNLLEFAPTVNEIHVMVQREVAQRLAAEPGASDYGIPSVMRAFWASAQVVARVPPTVFHPAPRVESAILAVVRRPTPEGAPDVEAVRSLVQQAFGQRRKMLRKSLGGRVTEDQLRLAGIEPTQRPEELGVADWCRLAGLPSEG